MASLLEKGVDAKNICYIDFSDDRLDLLRLEGSDPAVIEDNCYGMYPQKHEQMVYFFFDEVLFVNRWAQFVNRIQTTNCARCISPVLQQNCFQRRLQLSWGGGGLSLGRCFRSSWQNPKHTREKNGEPGCEVLLLMPYLMLVLLSLLSAWANAAWSVNISSPASLDNSTSSFWKYTSTPSSFNRLSTTKKSTQLRPNRLMAWYWVLRGMRRSFIWRTKTIK